MLLICGLDLDRPRKTPLESLPSLTHNSTHTTILPTRPSTSNDQPTSKITRLARPFFQEESRTELVYRCACEGELTHTYGTRLTYWCVHHVYVRIMFIWPDRKKIRVGEQIVTLCLRSDIVSELIVRSKCYRTFSMTPANLTNHPYRKQREELPK